MDAVKIESWNQADIPSIVKIWEGVPSAIRSDPRSEETFRNRVEDNPEFDPAGGLVARTDGTVAGFAVVVAGDASAGTLCALMVDPDYQRRGIASRLLEHAEAFLIDRHKETVRTASEDSPIWFTHGVDATSPAYFFFLNRGYRSTDTHCVVMDLDLAEFEQSEAIAGFIEENRRSGIEFGLCGAEHRKALDEFSQDLTSELTGDPPYPVTIATAGQRVIGFSEPFGVASGGRGGFDGVVTDENYRRRKIGTVLFNLMLSELKQRGATYTNLYAGLQSGEQEIYFQAGCKARGIVDFSLVRRLTS